MERGFRALAVIDEWSRESLVIEVDRSLTGERVKRVRAENLILRIRCRGWSRDRHRTNILLPFEIERLRHRLHLLVK
jgi:hypothetical protein